MPNRSKSPDTQQSSPSLNASQIAFKTQERPKWDIENKKKSVSEIKKIISLIFLC